MALRRRLLLHATLLPAAGRVGAADAPPASEPGAPRLIQYPRSQRGLEEEREYVVKLLHEALDASGLPHELAPSRHPMTQTRALRELAGGHGTIHVTWTMTSTERETELRPIRIPLYKGLYGWRVMLVRREQPDRLAAVRTLADLRRVPMAQGDDWPDTTILRANGVPVHTGSSFEALFALMQRGPAEAFPRSVAEVGWDAERHPQLFVIDRHLLLHYPAAIYAFVRPEDTQLADAIENGLNRLIASGRMEQLFRQFVLSQLPALDLGQRRVIELHNPLLPPKVPRHRRELWFKPA